MTSTATLTGFYTAGCGKTFIGVRGKTLLRVDASNLVNSK